MAIKELGRPRLALLSLLMKGNFNCFTEIFSYSLVGGNLALPQYCFPPLNRCKIIVFVDRVNNSDLADCKHRVSKCRLLETDSRADFYIYVMV